MTEYLFVVFLLGLFLGWSTELLFTFFVRKYFNSNYDHQIIREDIQNLTVKFEQLSDKITTAIRS
jgi:hypothetical protein